MDARSRRLCGMTAVELLVVMAISAVLATLAVPGFGSLRRAASLSAATNQLVWALHFARSSAIRDASPTTLCLTADDRTCIGSARAAATGWIVLQSPGAGSAAAPDAEVPRLHKFHLPPHMEVRGTRSAVTFWPVARAGTTATFEVCYTAGAPQGRAVIVSQIGRPRVAEGQRACAA